MTFGVSANRGRRSRPGRGRRWRARVVAWLLVAASLGVVLGGRPVSAGPNDLLLVTADGTASGRNADLSAFFTGLGWTVISIDDDSDPATLTAAAESAGVVWLAADSNTSVADELAAVRAPVVSEEVAGWGLLMRPGGGS